MRRSTRRSVSPRQKLLFSNEATPVENPRELQAAERKRVLLLSATRNGAVRRIGVAARALNWLNGGRLQSDVETGTVADHTPAESAKNVVVIADFDPEFHRFEDLGKLRTLIERGARMVGFAASESGEDAFLRFKHAFRQADAEQRIALCGKIFIGDGKKSAFHRACRSITAALAKCRG